MVRLRQTSVTKAKKVSLPSPPSGALRRIGGGGDECCCSAHGRTRAWGRAHHLAPERKKSPTPHLQRQLNSLRPIRRRDHDSRALSVNAGTGGWERKPIPARAWYVVGTRNLSPAPVVRRIGAGDTKQPAIFIRLTGQPPVGATRYEQEVLRRSASCATAKPAGSAKRLYYANALLPRKRVIPLEA